MTIGLVLAGAAVLLVLGYYVLERRTGKARSLIESLADIKPAPEPHYGCPYPPVSYIRDRLPKLEYPYMWESWVDTTPVKSVMTLRLVDLNGKTVATNVVDFTRGKTDTSYATKEYRNRRFRLMVADVLNWATRVALKCDYTPERTNYKIG